MSLSASDRAAFEDMRRNDPDGWEETEPNDSHRAAFAAWAVDTYGGKLFTRYMRDAWDEDDDPLPQDVYPLTEWS